jgi:hypothetical protein
MMCVHVTMHIFKNCVLPVLQGCVIDYVTLILHFFVQILARRLAILRKFFCGFPQSLHANVRMAPVLGHGSFVPNPFQFTTHPTI